MEMEGAPRLVKFRPRVGGGSALEGPVLFPPSFVSSSFFSSFFSVFVVVSVCFFLSFSSFFLSFFPRVCCGFPFFVPTTCYYYIWCFLFFFFPFDFISPVFWNSPAGLRAAAGGLGGPGRGLREPLRQPGGQRVLEGRRSVEVATEGRGDGGTSEGRSSSQGCLKIFFGWEFFFFLGGGGVKLK